MIYTHLAAAVIAALAAWFFQDNRYAAELAELRLEQTSAVLDATNAVRTQERAISKTYQEALNAATQRETVSRRHLDAAARESDGLRAQLSDTARRIADAPPTTVAEYATAVSGLFADCSRDYQGLAGKATGHANDVRKHREAWPVIPGK
jgi:hypothetical protein